MKKLISIVILTISAILTPLNVHSQEQDGCFMLDPTGRTVNTGGLCPEINPPNPNITPSSNPAPTSSTGIHRVKIKRREGGIPVIDVTFNGRHTFEMMLDTGATATIVTPKMASAIGFNELGTVPFETAGGTIRAPIGRVKSAKVGTAVVQNLIVGVVSSLDIGLLGQNFFGEYDLTIKKDVIEFKHR